MIELNADVGEGAGADTELLALVERANIACGWHAGDGAQMRTALQACKALGVAAGAHPSFPDRAGFGRTPMQRAAQDVEADLMAQIAGLQALAVREGVRLAHVKPHGALYNQAARDGVLADAVARAVRAVDPGLALVGLAGSQLLVAAQRHGLRPLAEAFADRAYATDGSLLPRGQPGAVLHETEAVLAQVRELVLHQRVRCAAGWLPLQADTLCLHGDGPAALELARALRAHWPRRSSA